MAAVVAVKLVAWLSAGVEPMVARTRNGVDNIIYYSLIAPLKLGIILLGIASCCYSSLLDLTSVSQMQMYFIH